MEVAPLNDQRTAGEVLQGFGEEEARTKTRPDYNELIVFFVDVLCAYPVDLHDRFPYCCSLIENRLSNHLHVSNVPLRSACHLLKPGVSLRHALGSQFYVTFETKRSSSLLKSLRAMG